MAEHAERAFARHAARPARGKASRKPKNAKAATAHRDKAVEERDAALDAARAEIVAALDMLERLATLQPTIERESLCGSAWKRMAMLEAMAKRTDAEAKAIANMKLRYANAEQLARASNDPQLFYPALNRMAAELIVEGAKPGWRGFDSGATTDVMRNLAAKTRDDADFWSVVGLTELRLYQAIAERNLAAELDTIIREYRDLHGRMDATTNWRTVLDQVRFVLEKYEVRATAPERSAATALTKQLEELAQGCLRS